MRAALAAGLVAGLVVLLVAPMAAAQVATTGTGGSGHNIVQCTERELVAIAGVITASDIIGCLSSPDVARTATSTRSIAWNVQGPDIPTGGVAAFTASTVSATGCTVSAWTTISELLAAGTGATSYATITMTSNECNVLAKMVVAAGAVPVTLATFVMPVNIYVEQTSFSNALSGGVTVTDDANGWAITGVTTGGGGTTTINFPTDFNATLRGALDVNATLDGGADVHNPVSDFWFPILFWCAVLAISWRKGWVWAFWTAVPGLIYTLLPGIFPAPFDQFETHFMLWLGGVAAEWFVWRGNQTDGTW